MDREELIDLALKGLLTTGLKDFTRRGVAQARAEVEQIERRIAELHSELASCLQDPPPGPDTEDSRHMCEEEPLLNDKHTDKGDAGTGLKQGYLQDPQRNGGDGKTKGMVNAGKGGVVDHFAGLSSRRAASSDSSGSSSSEDCSDSFADSDYEPEASSSDEHIISGIKVASRRQTLPRKAVNKLDDSSRGRHRKEKNGGVRKSTGVQMPRIPSLWEASLNSSTSGSESDEDSESGEDSDSSRSEKSAIRRGDGSRKNGDGDDSRKETCTVLREGRTDNGEALVGPSRLEVSGGNLGKDSPKSKVEMERRPVIQISEEDGSRGREDRGGGGGGGGGGGRGDDRGCFAMAAEQGSSNLIGENVGAVEETAKVVTPGRGSDSEEKVEVVRVSERSSQPNFGAELVSVSSSSLWSASSSSSDDAGNVVEAAETTSTLSQGKSINSGDQLSAAWRNRDVQTRMRGSVVVPRKVGAEMDIGAKSNMNNANVIPLNASAADRFYWILLQHHVEMSKAKNPGSSDMHGSDLEQKEGDGEGHSKGFDGTNKCSGRVGTRGEREEFHKLTGNSLPLAFESMERYAELFGRLILEETKAFLRIKAGGNGDNSKRPQPEYHGVWLRHAQDKDPENGFKYVEYWPGRQERTSDATSWARLDPDVAVLIVGAGGESEPSVMGVVHKATATACVIKTLPGCAAPPLAFFRRMESLKTLRRMYEAVSALGTLQASLSSVILNPRLNDAQVQKFSYDQQVHDAQNVIGALGLKAWFEKGLLNSSQLIALASSLRPKNSFSLIQGPPGTGKSTTVVGIISAYLALYPNLRILVCAPSNAALDQLVERLLSSLIDPTGKLYAPALGTVVRVGPNMDKKLRPQAALESVQDGNLPFYKAKQAALRNASVVCTTLAASRGPDLEELPYKFDLLIVDEAAQAVEPETLMALSRVQGSCVLVGDPCQLPPTVFMRPSVAFERSMFERLQQAGHPFTLLLQQYRMHPEVRSFPSRFFYGGAIVDSPSIHSRQTIFDGSTCIRDQPMSGYSITLGAYRFLDVQWGLDEIQNRSRANKAEVKVIMAIATALHDVLGAWHGAGDVGIITPYRAQQSILLRNLGRLLKDRNGSPINRFEVNTVDGFQGGEKDVVIFSSVRSGKGLGFMSDLRRGNVALTRARHCLIIVGDAATLSRHSAAWFALIDDARKRGCYQEVGRKQSSCVRSLQSCQIGSSIGRTDANGSNAGRSKPVEAGISANHPLPGSASHACKGHERAHAQARRQHKTGMVGNDSNRVQANNTEAHHWYKEKKRKAAVDNSHGQGGGGSKRGSSWPRKSEGKQKYQKRNHRSTRTQV